MRTIIRIYYYNNITKKYDEEEFLLNERDHRFKYGYLKDINSDNRLDIVTAYDSDTFPPGINSPNPKYYEKWYSDANMVFLQKNGTYSTVPDYIEETPNRLKYLEFRDLNGDNLEDMIRKTRSSGMEILFQETNFSFGNTIRTGGCSNLYFYDFNGDNITDIVTNTITYRSTGNKISIYLLKDDTNKNGLSDTFDDYYFEIEEIKGEKLDFA